MCAVTAQFILRLVVSHIEYVEYSNDFSRYYVSLQHYSGQPLVFRFLRCYSVVQVRLTFFRCQEYSTVLKGFQGVILWYLGSI